MQKTLIRWITIFTILIGAGSSAESKMLRDYLTEGWEIKGYTTIGAYNQIFMQYKYQVILCLLTEVLTCNDLSGVTVDIRMRQ